MEPTKAPKSQGFPPQFACALDYPDEASALGQVDALMHQCNLYKVGLELFISCGPSIVEKLRSRGCRVFLDLKLHDIPETVARATSAACALGVDFLTVHAGGGLEMLRRAKESASGRTQILGVTILTSLELADLVPLGIVAESLADLVVKRAQLCKESGVDGVVCSPREVKRLRTLLGPDFFLCTPGIRLLDEGAKQTPKPTDDQKRTGAASQAVADGADLLVVGRPLKENPTGVAGELHRQIALGLSQRQPQRQL